MISFPKALSSAIVLFCFPAHSGFEAIAQLGPIAKEIGKRTAKKTKPIKNSRTAANYLGFTCNFEGARNSQ